MRYYDIKITNPQTGADVLPSSLQGRPISSLFPDGSTNPGALNIQYDIAQLAFNNPDTNSWVRIWGLGIKDTSAALDLNGMNISVSAGMSKGLPLANPAQRGLFVKGTIFQAFGNWVGTDMTVDLNIRAGGGSSDAPLNFPFTWKAGTPLGIAIGQTLSIAMPTFKQNIQVSPKLIINHDETGHYETAEQFADFINERSQPIIGGTYRGVTIATNGETVNVFDGTVAPQTSAIKQIAFQDMIGQPTWINIQEISVIFVARGDLNVGDIIHIPPAVYTLTLASVPRFQDRTNFTGNFLISQIHHYGNFRQADAASWNTTVQAIYLPADIVPQGTVTIDPLQVK